MNNDIIKNSICSDLFISQNNVFVSNEKIIVNYNNRVFKIKNTGTISGHDVSRFILSKCDL